MEGFLNSGIQFILWFQNLGSWLAPVMKLFTFLGNEQFYLLIAPAILWCVDSTLGVRLGIFLMINGSLNSMFKMAFHNPRPYWYSTDVRVLSTAENSFGLPSGHAQNAIVIWGALAQHIKTRWTWIVVILVMIMIGLSRIYLAMHFPIDVVFGWAFGIVILWVLLRMEKPLINWIKKYTTIGQILIVFLFSLILTSLMLLPLLSLTNWAIPTNWTRNALLAYPADPAITPLSPHNALTAPAAFFGLAAGWIWIQSKGGFSTQEKWWRLIARYVVGLIGILILYAGLGSIFPETETLLAYLLRYLRYSLIGFWISGMAPWLFIKLRLAANTLPTSIKIKQAG